MIAVQVGQAGWDPRCGNRFVVEFERSRTPSLSSSGDRNRLWALLDDDRRAEAIEIGNAIARTLPPPDPAVLSGMPEDLRPTYLRRWEPNFTIASSDVWFRYYDEADARVWGEFLASSMGLALARFLAGPPSFFGHRPTARP